MRIEAFNYYPPINIIKSLGNTSQITRKPLIELCISVYMEAPTGQVALKGRWQRLENPDSITFSDKDPSFY